MKKSFFTFISLILITTITGCSNEKIPSNLDKLDSEISKMKKRLKKLDEVNQFEERSELKAKIQKYVNKNLNLWWVNAKYKKGKNQKLYINKNQKVYLLTGSGDMSSVTYQKNKPIMVPSSISRTYQGTLNKKREKKNYLGGSTWGKHVGTYEITYKLSKSKKQLCEFKKLIASMDFNQNNLTYQMVVPYYKGKVEKTCYGK